MPLPTVFLSAATVDLRDWRDVLDTAFRRGGFLVLTQDKSLGSAPGDVKRLLSETVARSDCIIHLAGIGYGSQATDPFAACPAFQCSWTQFEYYHAHQQKKDVIAFVCAPSLSRAGFVEEGDDAADVARKQRLQQEHRERVASGKFDGTPLAGAVGRTCNEAVGSVAALLQAVAAAVGTLHKLDREACAKAQQELHDLAAAIARIESGVGSANQKLDDILGYLRSGAGAARRPAPPLQLPPPAAKYFGRGDLVAELAELLRQQKRTDVWGGPGMGKTALAAEALGGIIVAADPAALAASPFPDGVVFLNLYQTKTLDNSWSTLASTFDDTLPTDMPAAARARRACAHRRALVILEGAEELKGSLNDFLAIQDAATSLLVLTRLESQTAAGRRIKLDDLLEPADALKLLRHLAGAKVPQPVLDAVQARLGGHPLALTWAGSQLADATQPAVAFLAELKAQGFPALSEPGGDPAHTLRWMFDRSARLMDEPTRTLLAAASRIAEPFGADFAQVAGGQSTDLQHLVRLAFLRLDDGQTGWQFAHALAAQYARDLQLPDGLLGRLGGWAVAALEAADAAGAGLAALDLALAHAIALLGHDRGERVLGPVASALLYHGPDRDETLGIRRGRLDFARRALDAIRQWQDRAGAEEKKTPAWQREHSVVLNRLGDLAVAQGDLPEARRLFGEALAIAQRLAAADPANAAWQRDLSVSLNKLGDLAVAQGDLPEARRLFGEALAIAQRLAATDPANAAWQRDLSVSLNKLGELAVAQGDLPEARRLFGEAQVIRQRLAAADPANAAWQRDLSVSLNKLGDLAVAQGDLPEARRLFGECLLISQRLAAADPANAEWQRDLSVSLNKLGDLAVAQGDLPEARRLFGECQVIRQRLAAADPANAAWQRDLSVSLEKLGGLAVAQGDLPEARRLFGQCLLIRQRLAAADPANAAWQRDLSVSLNKLGDLAVAQGDLPAARRLFGESQVIFQRLAAADPANAAWQRDLSYSLTAIAQVLERQERWAAALELMEKSLDIDARLAASDRTNLMWQQDERVSRRMVSELRVKVQGQ